MGIESVICNLHMCGLSCSRAKVTQNENLLDNDSSVLSSLVTQLQFSYIFRGRLCEYTTHVMGSQIRYRIDPLNDTEHLTIIAL